MLLWFLTQENSIFTRRNKNNLSVKNSYEVEPVKLLTLTVFGFVLLQFYKED